jgi:hypothetical protein
MLLVMLPLADVGFKLKVDLLVDPQLKQDPVDSQLKQDPVDSQLKQDPVDSQLKQDPVDPLRKGALDQRLVSEQ